MNQDHIQSTTTTTTTTTTTSSSTSQSPSSSSRARARWSILRSAILSNKDKNKKCNGNSNNNADTRGTTTTTTTTTTSSTLPFTLQKKEHAIDDSDEGDCNNNNVSIHSFKGFRMLDRTIIPKKPLEDYEFVEMAEHDDFEFVEYSIPTTYMSSSSSSSSYEYSTIHTRAQGTESQEEIYIIKKLKTREKCPNNKVQMKDLMSHVHYGVDNTGNTRLWDSSSVLTYCIANGTQRQRDTSLGLNLSKSLHSCMSRDTPPSVLGLKHLFALARKPPPPANSSLLLGPESQIKSIPKKVLNVVELGAGMCALASLFLATVVGVNDNNVYVRAIVTDGHPHSVLNNECCARLNHMSSSVQTTMEKNVFVAHKLLWKGNEEGAAECKVLRQKYLSHDASGTINEDQAFFDLCIVSDCTHFKEFHADLAITIARLLRVGGKCICMQPARGRTLEQFIDLLRDMNRGDDDCGGGNELFEICLYDNYNHHVSQKHCELIENTDSCNIVYKPSIHYPLLLELKKKRTFVEHLDGKVALEHMKHRL